MPRRRDNKIDANEAELIGDFLVTIGEELNDANVELRANVLKDSDVKSARDYYFIDDAEAEYQMEVEVGRKADGAGRKRKSQVTMSAKYKRASTSSEMSPFNVLFGAIAPSERRREEILGILSKSFPDLDFSPYVPIFHCGNGNFWVSVEDGGAYYVVSLDGTGRATLVTTLEDMQENIAGMLSFLQTQLTKVYNRS